MADTNIMETHPHGREVLSLEQTLIACLACPDSVLPITHAGIPVAVMVPRAKWDKSRLIDEQHWKDITMCVEFWNNHTSKAHRDEFCKQWRAKEAAAGPAKKEVAALPPPEPPRPPA